MVETNFINSGKIEIEKNVVECKSGNLYQVMINCKGEGESKRVAFITEDESDLDCFKGIDFNMPSLENVINHLELETKQESNIITCVYETIKKLGSLK